MKTWFPNKAQPITKDWLCIDAKGLTLGRLASEVARLLRGKHKPQFTPHADSGDAVIIVNCAAIATTGNKLEDKIYYRHTGYPGGIRSRQLKDQLIKDPTQVLRLAVKRMLPRTPLGRRQLRSLYLYAGQQHAHQAQKPMAYQTARAQSPSRRSVKQTADN